MKDLQTANHKFNITCLRYFNPVGAHSSGLIGESPNGIPNNLMPYIQKVANKKLPILSVYGNDYDTADGTGVRDYIHVVDLAQGHVSALQAFRDAQVDNLLITNLGTGQGYSVLEMAKAFEAASGHSVPCQIVPRRDGDVASCFADPAYALKTLGWKADKSLQDMCEDTWRWQSQNPDGYA
mgnify:CR=1 FL=1